MAEPTDITTKATGERGSLKETLAGLRQFVDDLTLSEEVVELTIPSGTPYSFEAELWDYKACLPTLKEKPSQADKDAHDVELASIIKDVLAFYNTYGGYIIFGVTDKGTDRVVGCSADLDCGDLNKRVLGFTGHGIECFYMRLRVTALPDLMEVGVLLVPRRPAGSPPVRFRREGPLRPAGKGRVFTRETYVRVRDECRPATATSEDWQLLHSDRSPPKRTTIELRRQVQSALPARDPELTKFVGRETSLATLREWVLDPRSPIRLVTGIGGLGKTTLAFRFAEEVVNTGAGDVEWVIWLTAKPSTYSAHRGHLVTLPPEMPPF